jgi:FMN phosphatase YigB (HAD superfamily)
VKEQCVSAKGLYRQGVIWKTIFIGLNPGVEEILKLTKKYIAVYIVWNGDSHYGNYILESYGLTIRRLSDDVYVGSYLTILNIETSQINMER